MWYVLKCLSLENVSTEYLLSDVYYAMSSIEYKYINDWERQDFTASFAHNYVIHALLRYSRNFRFFTT